MRNSSITSRGGNSSGSGHKISLVAVYGAVFFGMANMAEKEGSVERAIDEYRSYLTRNPDGPMPRSLLS